MENERYIIVPEVPKFGIRRHPSGAADLWHITFRKDMMNADQAVEFGERLEKFRSFKSCNCLTVASGEYRYTIRYAFRSAVKLQAMMIRVRKSWEEFMQKTTLNG